MNTTPWPCRIIPSVMWKSLFWIIRNAAAAARMGWDAAGPVGVPSRLRP